MPSHRPVARRTYLPPRLTRPRADRAAVEGKSVVRSLEQFTPVSGNYAGPS